VLALAACSAPEASEPAASAPASAAAGGDCPTSEPAPLPAGETRDVTITTDLGEIVIGLSADLSPIAVANFAALAACDYYDGIVFHRVVPGFVIQGGDPTGTGTGGPGYTITDEPVTTEYARGTVAMARTPEPNSVGSQFFIVLDDSARTSLESANTYQIIGTVTSGMEVADAIAAAADAEIPSDPVVMTDVSID
jgi:cyclophilin family peptidyl-prolyl cis-trans isomerase